MGTRKTWMFLLGAIAVSTLAASFRWPDSAHAIGVIREGGAARHPVKLGGGREAHVLVVTATVLPPFRGDARISVDGAPAMGWEAALSLPVVDLGLHRWPSLDADTLRGLAPGDRVALWVKLRPPRADPVCGMPCGEGAVREALGGRDECFCSAACREAFRADPPRFPPRPIARGRWTLALREARSGRPVLTVPIELGEEEAGHAGEHH